MKQMKARLLCKKCKDIVSPQGHDFASCKCGAMQTQAVLSGKGYAVSPGADYALVDDEDNEIIITDELAEAKLIIDTSDAMSDSLKEHAGDAVDHAYIYRELMLALNLQIQAMESLSSAGRFSPATNQDLLAHLVWLQAMLKSLELKELSFEAKVIELLKVADSRAEEALEKRMRELIGAKDWYEFEPKTAKKSSSSQRPHGKTPREP